MRRSNFILKACTLSLVSLLSATVFAADQFFEVGKSYLFVPRLDLVMRGTVTQITDQEIVFTDRALLKASKATANVANNDAKSGAIKSAAIMEYLKSDKAKRETLVEASTMKNIPTSYSRSALTAIKIDS